MGYRSEVALLIYGDAEPMVAYIAGEKLKGLPPEHKKHPFDGETHDHWFRSSRTEYRNGEQILLRFKWNGIKWYNTYADIEWWENLMLDFKENYDDNTQFDMNLEFIRIGEDENDIDTLYYGLNNEYFLRTHREIIDDAP